MGSKEDEIGSENGKPEPPKDGSICGFDSLHRLLQSSLPPQLFQEVSRLLLGLNCGRPLDAITVPQSAKSLSAEHDFDLQRKGLAYTTYR